MMDFSTVLQRGENFTTPLMLNEHPFWICGCGHTYKNEAFHEISSNTAISRIEYIISGECVLNTKNISCIASAGDTYFLHQGDDHNYYPANAAIVEKLWINLKGELIPELTRLYNINDVVLFKNTNSSKFINDIHCICKNNSDPYVIQEQVSTKLFELIKFLSRKHKKAQSNADDIDKIRSYIDLHIYDKITIADLTKISYTTAEHTINTFKNKFGITPHQYIMQSKIQLSKTLIVSSDSNIQEISELLNFSSIGHFSNMFYKYTGIRPSKFKANAK